MEEYTLSGEVGTSFVIDDKLFTLKDDYYLHQKPDVVKTVFSESDQTFIFIYKDLADNDQSERENNEVSKEENLKINEKISRLRYLILQLVMI